MSTLEVRNVSVHYPTPQGAPVHALEEVSLTIRGTDFVVALSARAGVRSASIEQIHAAYSLGASRFQVLSQVILKAAMPEILTGMRIGIGFGWTTLVAAEMVAAQAGLGVMVLNAAEFLVTDVVVTGIVIIGGIAYAFDLFMRYVERLLVPWKGKV